MPGQLTPFNIPKKQFRAPQDPGAGHAAQTLQSIVASIHSTASIPSIGSSAAKGLQRAMSAYDRAADKSIKAWEARRAANAEEWKEYRDDERRVSGELVGILARGDGKGGSGGGKPAEGTVLDTIGDEVVKRLKAYGAVDPNIAKKRVTFEGGLGYSDTNETDRFAAPTRLGLITDYVADGGALAVSDKILANSSTTNPDDIDKYPVGVFTPDGKTLPAMRVRIESRKETMRRNPAGGQRSSINYSQTPTGTLPPRQTVTNTYYIVEPNYGPRKKGARYYGQNYGSYPDVEAYNAAQWDSAQRVIDNRAQSEAAGEGKDVFNVEHYMNIWRKNNATPAVFNEDAPITRGQAYLRKIMGMFRGGGDEDIETPKNVQDIERILSDESSIRLPRTPVAVPETGVRDTRGGVTVQRAVGDLENQLGYPVSAVEDVVVSTPASGDSPYPYLLNFIGPDGKRSTIDVRNITAAEAALLPQSVRDKLRELGATLPTE